MNKYLILPMGFYVFYIFIIGIITFRARKYAVQSGQMHIKHFRSYVGEIPERVTITGRHFDNQFQMPMLFLITCVTYMALNLTDSLAVLLAWLFVATRMRHTQVHLGHNKIMPRALSFMMGFVVILVMWAQIMALEWSR